MLRQGLAVLIQLCFIEHAVGDDLVANGIVDQREEVRAAIVAKRAVSTAVIDKPTVCLDRLYSEGVPS